MPGAAPGRATFNNQRNTMTNALTTTAAPTGFGMLISPTTLEAAREVATLLSKSDLVPKAFAGKPNDILIAGAMGSRLGLDLFSALSGIAVVNGRPTLWGDAQLAVCQSRPDWAGMKVEATGAGDTYAVTVTVTRKGHAEPYVGTFSMADAKRAGLAGKQGPWSQYPTRMCMLRARAFALRQAFADALAGFHAREEIEDEVDVTASARVIPEPKPARRRAVEPAAEQPADKGQGAATEASAADEAEGQAAEQQAAATEPAAQAGADQEPPPLNHQTLDAYARRLHGEHKARFAAELKELVARLGVAKLSEVPAEGMEAAHAGLKAIERALVEGA